MFASDGAFTPIEPSGMLARVSEVDVPVEDVHGWPCRAAEFGAVEGIPDPAPGLVFIVSALVRDAAQRDDVVSPDTSLGAVRDSAGRIIGTRGFVRVKAKP